MNSNYRRFGAFSSSENPDELAAKVKAVILALSVLIIYIALKVFHITLTPDDVNQLATELGSFAAAAWFAYGLVRQLLIWCIDKWNGRGKIQ